MEIDHLEYTQTHLYTCTRLRDLLTPDKHQIVLLSSTDYCIHTIS